MARRLDRRIFLRGLGGACVAAPFLGSIEPREVKAQSVAPARRLIAMFTRYGCITTRWFPTKSHGVLNADDLAPTTLKHLAPYADKLLMPRGLRAMNEWSVDMTLGQANDPYINVTGSYFTCQPLNPNSDTYSPPLSPTRVQQRPLGPSLDHVIAQQLSPEGQPLVMRLGRAPDGTSSVSFSAAETTYVGIDNSNYIYTTLTGLFASGGLSPDSYQALRGKSVLDLVKGDLETLERFDMSQADRDKLAAWKELLHETSHACSQELATSLSLNDETTTIVPGGFGNDSVSVPIEGTSLDGADVYTNLAVLAAACNVNPVILLVYPVAHVYKGLGQTQDSQALANRIGALHLGGTCVPDVIEKLITIDDFYARKFAHLVGKLDELSEGDGSMLDQSAAVWFQEVSDGAARNLNNLPVLQAGSCGGYFKTGWAINVEDGAADLTRGNSEALCADGTASEITFEEHSAKVTGTDRSLANAPINKYYCSLMNALGVKARPDGFPLASGTAEVSHFGRYDRTEDFIGGAVNPPVIHDPGEFSALRAGAS